MAILDVVFGRPLASGEASGEKIGPAVGIPIFGLDALSSAAYGPEACLTLLIPLGLPGVHCIVPLSLAIVALLTIVFFSYRQTIHAYPDGGGSYTVARENLGDRAGLLAAAALMIDYILVVAVGISAGVGALVSAVPSLHPHMLVICLGILLAITLVNLRGVKDSGGAFMYPTYLFTGTMLIVIAIGAWKVLAAGAGGHPAPVVAPPIPAAPTEALGLWLLLRAFASGCTALTGVEAVSNGVQAFRTNKDAQRTLTAIIGLLIILLAGIAWLVSAYGIVATDPDGTHYESLLSLLVGAVVGKGIFYYITIAGILLVVCLSANTAFADFPRLCRIVAHDDYLPHSLSARGRRLVFTEGIWALAFFAALLLIVFGGVTDRLIPLFAIGAFLAFTLSQSGMVAHWKRTGGPGSAQSMLVNGLGALTTGITVIVVLVAKFSE
ncbi:MAG TPA: APC family permease, partial [Bryobacteraceae bacterium]